jgi:Glycosidases
VVGRRTGDGVLLGEVNLPYEQQLEFFGGTDGDELTMQFDFIGMQALYLSLARADAGPLATALAGRPALDPDSQWATFVRNHDELTLDKLTDDERQEVFAAFGPEERMQVYGRGLRRRLPPMLDGDPRRVRMVYSLLFSLPGTPVLFYGEEIGMGEDLDAEGRLAVRTPMQWTSGRNGGFSTADPDRLPVRWSTAGSRRSSSTWPTSAATRTRCCRSPSCSSAATVSRRSWAGAGSSCSSSRTARCWPTCAAGTTARWSPSTTSAPSRAPCR